MVKLLQNYKAGWPKMLPCLWTGCGKMKLAKHAGDRYCPACRRAMEHAQTSNCLGFVYRKDRRSSLERGKDNS